MNFHLHAYIDGISRDRNSSFEHLACRESKTFMLSSSKSYLRDLEKRKRQSWQCLSFFCVLLTLSPFIIGKQLDISITIMYFKVMELKNQWHLSHHRQDEIHVQKMLCSRNRQQRLRENIDWSSGQSNSNQNFIRPIK